MVMQTGTEFANSLFSSSTLLAEGVSSQCSTKFVMHISQHSTELHSIFKSVI